MKKIIINTFRVFGFFFVTFIFFNCKSHELTRVLEAQKEINDIFEKIISKRGDTNALWQKLNNYSKDSNSFVRIAVVLRL